MKNRGGFDGSYEEAVKSVRHFFKEMLYQLVDGFSVNLGYFSVHPNIGGTFVNENEIHDHKKHLVRANRDFPGIPDATYKIVVITQFVGGGNLLKAPAP